MNLNKNNNYLILIIFLLSIFLFMNLFKYQSKKNSFIIDKINRYSRPNIKNYHSLNPIIFTIDNFLSNDECTEIINMSNKLKFQKGYVLNSESENSLSEFRTNSLIWINHNKTENVKKIVNRISSLISIPSENAEDLQLIRYKKNEHYNHHYDAFQKESKYYDNQRLVTALVYLTDVQKGGETEFSKINLKIKPKKGKLLIFYNCLNDGKTINNNTLHAGLPIIEGEKYAFNLWFHEKCYRN